MSKEIPLTQGYVALVDDEDYDSLSQVKWYALVSRNTVYAVRGVNEPSRGVNGTRRRAIHMHRIVMDAPDGMEVDHINGDGLDNRKQNLRVVTHRQNLLNSRMKENNTSGYRGVSWRKDRNKWQVRIKDGEVYRSLGYFDVKEEAALAYNHAARELFGEFVRLNKVEL